MKNILIFPGLVDNPFFENEIDYAKSQFNIAAVLSYGDEKEAAERVLEKHGISRDKLYIIPRVYSSVFKGKLNISKLILWLQRKEVRDEIKKKCFKGPKKFKRLCAVLNYGGYALLSEKIVSSLDIICDNICLYSFWMSESAYTLAYLKDMGYFPDAKLFCRAHGYDIYEEREDNDMKYLPFRSYINENMSKISFISEHGKSYFTSRFPDPKNKSVSYLGTKNDKSYRKNISAKDEICIASCSNVISVKRLDYIISAMESLNGLNVHWIHLGDGVLLESMKALAEQKLADTTVRWDFFGNVANDKVFDIYMQYDVDFLINLSDSEGLPVSIMEAFSMGIPVIARSVGGINEIVCGENGLLLNERWEDENYGKIRNFVKCRLEKLDQYTILSENAFHVWMDKFNADKNFTEFFENMYKMSNES